MEFGTLRNRGVSAGGEVTLASTALTVPSRVLQLDTPPTRLLANQPHTGAYAPPRVADISA